MKRVVLVAIGTLLAPVVYAEQDPLCVALREFANSMPLTSAETVIVKTDWGADPTMGCVRGKGREAARLCEKLVATLSIEFMTMNVRRAMACMFQHPDKVDALPELETKAGSAIARLSALRNRQVMLTVAYDTEQRGTELPFMELIFTPLKDGAHLRR